MTHRQRITRRGLVLPLVLLGMLLICVMSVALQQSAWRSARGARATWDAQRGLYGADAAVVRAVASWPSDSMADTPIGTRFTRNESTVDGWQTRTTLLRTGTLTALVQATTERVRAAVANAALLGDASRIRRTVTRVLRLVPPHVPIRAAVTVLGDTDVRRAIIDGRDQIAVYDARVDDCGPLRDTASVSAIASAAVNVQEAPTLFGVLAALSVATLTRDRIAFDSAFARVASRAQIVTPLASASPTAAPWRAMVISRTGGVTIDSAFSHRGLLAIDGDLTIRGSLVVEGLLVVRGALNASLGVLSVRGALVVGDGPRIGSQLGPGVHVTYAPCLVGRALVSVAEPRSSPFGAWNAL